MSFMQQQVTGKIDWLEIEADGTWFIPSEDAPEVLAVLNNHHAWDKDEDSQNDLLCETASDYAEGDVIGVQLRTGYGARLSAPGYMDRTDWSVFDTEEEAQTYLEETYPEDEDE
jgi:hypothetical protein